VAVDLLHVTLAFIGAVPDVQLPDLVARLSAAAASSEPFSLRVCGVRAVPSAGRASMIWATMDGGEDEARELSERLGLAANLTRDPRLWRAHITLIRARRPRPADAAALGAAGAFLSAPGKEPERTVSVRSATVFSSTLGRQGPVYEPLSRISLGSGPGRASLD
jgi:2'-5' RNA ligase